MLIYGPEIQKDELPEKFIEFCPDGFKVFAIRYEVVKENEVSSNPSGFVFNDPYLRNLTDGE